MFLRYHYPKLGILIALSLFAYAFFTLDFFTTFTSSFIPDSVFAFFLVGILFSFGFTTPFAIGFFLVAHPSSPVIMALAGGFGAMAGDLLIFHSIRFSFIDEFGKLRRERFAQYVQKPIRLIPPRAYHYILYALAGIIIASPLPDELGVSLLAGLTAIRPLPLALISYTCNTLGILFLLLIS